MADESGRLNEISLFGGHLAGVMRAVLEKGARFRFMARGASMAPFIRDRDIITLYPSTSRRAGVGDVAAVFHFSTGSVVVHRIIGETPEGFVLKGDNCQSQDGMFAPSQVAGVVAMVERNGRRVWFGGGCGKKTLACLSRTGVLNRALLPLLRGIRRVFRK